ncbi:abscisic acid 8'-hydroxylase CYP707A1-like [Rosa rugosa]|uniref:abscisic acid 8'-hydroxylase CYP707A1-like n=1 Tax=Rosa rugosa TaxID=74645 RepID=UPI002B418461|nr:abscisic acid 8'-hydroxylase CYP707A1-like [Rosa rugosa]
MVAIFTYAFVSLLTIIFSYIFMKKNKGGEEELHDHGNENRAQLPPGSLGWPYIGETLQLYSQDPNIFFSARQRRYGKIFKTHILGCPCVMLASPEAAKFVLVTQAHLFRPTYPKSKEGLIGPSALFFHQGDYHIRLRKLVQGSLNLDAIRNLVPHIDAAAAFMTSESWGTGKVINTFHEMQKFSFEVGTLAIFGHLETRYKEELKKNYMVVDKGYNSFPINIPGTPYKKALLARERLRHILGDIIHERKEKRLPEKDLLGCLLSSINGGDVLSDDQIADNIIGVLFAAQDTTASVMTWIIKYLHDEPKLLEAVKAEQNAIRISNEQGNQPLSWAQTKIMPISYKVVLESLRMASIISFLFREAVVDVKYKGYLIPKGWKVMPLFRNIHHNPEFFTDPQKFDLSRFQVAPKPNTFMPFGIGVHACPGNELAKLELLIMIHHLVTKFRWEIEGSQSGIEYSPFPVPLKGLPVKFWRLE